MTRFQTPSESSGSSLARELLELGRSEQASAQVHARAAQAGLGALSGTTAAASATAGWFASGAAIKLAAAMSVVALGAGVFRFVAAERHGETAPKSRVLQPTRAAAPGRGARSDLETASATPTASAPSSELPRARKELGVRAIDSASSRPRPQDGLGREIAVLDRAKALLAAGDAKGALRAAEGQHMRILGPEALALKVEALIAAGDIVRARRLATQFLASYPTSPLARRVEELRKSLTRSSDAESSNEEVRQP